MRKPGTRKMTSECQCQYWNSSLLTKPHYTFEQIYLSTIKPKYLHCLHGICVM